MAVFFNLQSQRTALAEQLQELSKEREKAARMKKRAEDVRDRAWILDDTSVNALLIIYTLCNFELRPCVEFLLKIARKRRWPLLGPSVVGATVERIFLKTDAKHVAALVDSDGSSDPIAFRVALPIVENWKVMVWGMRINADQGVAPSSAQLLNQIKVECSGLPASVFAKTTSGRPASAARLWASRFRAAWKIRMGSVRVCDNLPAGEFRRKVCELGLCCARGRHLAVWGEAAASWQWCNFYYEKSDKRILMLNLDETSIECFAGCSKGCVFPGSRRGGQVLRRMPKRQRRKCLTHVAVIANDKVVQKTLPQFVIGNEATFLRRDFAELEAAAGPHVVLIRFAFRSEITGMCLHVFGLLRGRRALGTTSDCLQRY